MPIQRREIITVYKSMYGESIITVCSVQSPFLEELHATFECISKLESLFLSPDAPDTINSYHSRMKLLASQLNNYIGPINCISEFDEALKSMSIPYVPVSLSSFHSSFDEIPSPIPVLQTDPVKHLEQPKINPTVKLLKYPQIHSVQFSLIDTEEQLESLNQILSDPQDGAVGVNVIYHPNPLSISALCIATRECEYLIDLVEVPNALKILQPFFANPEVTKVFHNTAHCCRILRSFGLADIYNVFCVTTAAMQLDININTSIKSLTNEVRVRLSEGWIPDGPSDPHLLMLPPEERSLDNLTKILTETELAADHDWRLRPLSLAQMRVARQRMHYLLYLYDALRLKLNEKGEEQLANAQLIAHHKSEMDWSGFRFILGAPNATILSTVYEQPMPNSGLVRSLSQARQAECNGCTPQVVFSDAALLWTALCIPKTAKALDACADEATAKHRTMFILPPLELPKNLSSALLAVLEKAPIPSDSREPKEKKQKTLEELITEIGWLPVDEQFDTPKRPNQPVALETTVSPRLAKNAKSDPSAQPGASLRHLRDPDQPTLVSKQIEGIPRTEAQIFQLANNVRMIQKNGKQKMKMPTAKDEAIPDESPDDVLRSLLNIGYIDEADVKAIKARLAAPKPIKPGPKRGRSKDSKTPPSQARVPPPKRSAPRV